MKGQLDEREHERGSFVWGDNLKIGIQWQAGDGQWHRRLFPSKSSIQSYMPSKTIEQLFEFKLSSQKSAFIRARNYNEHISSFTNINTLSVEDMRALALFLITTANEIDNDPDFKK